MQVVTAKFVAGKKILLRFDIDVQITKGKVTEDFKMRAELPTLDLCLQNAKQVILLGHLGRPQGQAVPQLSVEPVRKWFTNQGFSGSNFRILENLRFDPREEDGDLSFAKELAAMGDIYINEGFGSYRPAVSTTVLPTLLPHAAGLRFAEEVEKLTKIRENPKKPFVAIMGGAKVKEKLPVIEVLARSADVILIGGKLISEIREQNIQLPKNAMVGKLNEDGFDIALETVESWRSLISKAAQIVWNGPLGKFEDPKNDATEKVAQIVLESGAEIVIGGGDCVAALGQYGLLQKAVEKAFVSVGGGAMLKFLSDGTLPTIEALRDS